MEQIINVIYVALPYLVWIVEAGLVAGLIWGIVRYVKRRRRG